MAYYGFSPLCNEIKKFVVEIPFIVATLNGFATIRESDFQKSPVFRVS